MAEIREIVLKTSESIAKISRRYGLSADIVAKNLKENYGLTGKNRFDYRCAKAFADYQSGDTNLDQILENHGISSTAYYKFVKKFENNLPTEKIKYSVNSNYFNEINSADKAYWLGFLYADGFNSNSYLQVAICSEDVNHLRKLRKALGSTHPIRYYPQDNTVRITISDKKISTDLNEAGCIRNKTYCGHFPGWTILPRIYIRDFVRGFFDGDGTINKIIRQEVTSANSIQRKIDKLAFTIHLERMAKSLIEAISIMCGVKANLYYYEPHNKYEVYIQGQDNVRKFLDCIYKEASVYLDRKYAQYLRYILPSDLEIDQIISEKLSGNVLPALAQDHSIG